MSRNRGGVGNTAGAGTKETMAMTTPEDSIEALAKQLEKPGLSYFDIDKIEKKIEVLEQLKK